MTRRRLPLFLLLILAAAALLAAGCGGGADKGAYEQGLAKVQSHLDDAAKASQASGGTTDQAERRAKLEEAHDEIAKAADEAEQLDPPDDARKANATFAKALRDYADLFGKLAALEPNDPQETELYSKAGEIAQRLDKANRALAKAGYEADKGSK